jgi:hypothetical protein|tara:strand:+ start:833 stop:1249 length:417 start_codon:yes stop_codon:yes gene_type:complete
MAKRKAPKRRTQGIRVLNVLESLTYAEIISRGTTGGGLGSLIFGDTDLGYKSGNVGIGSLETSVAVGTDQISLGDLMSEPGQAVSVMAANFQANLLPMAVAGFTTSVGFNVGRRLLRKPINNINRNIMKPLFGAGIRM